MIELQIFITLVLNLIYLIETLSNLIFNNACVQWLAYKIPLFSTWLYRLVPGLPQYLLFSAFPQRSVLVPIIALIRLYFNYSFTLLSSALDNDLLKEKGIVLLLNSSVLNMVQGTQKQLSKCQLRWWINEMCFLMK